MAVSIENTNNRLLAQSDFIRAKREYEAFFGMGTLERVIYIDPLHPQAEDFTEAAGLLRKAVKDNKLLEQVPEDFWKQLVF